MTTKLRGINLKFIDSLNFVPNKLSIFAKIFGFKNMLKGYFPHKFNIPENQSYVGKVPGEEYFAPGAMKPEEYKDFKKWYDEHKDDNFDFQVELEKYCDQCVHIVFVAA